VPAEAVLPAAIERATAYASKGSSSLAARDASGPFLWLIEGCTTLQRKRPRRAGDSTRRQTMHMLKREMYRDAVTLFALDFHGVPLPPRPSSKL